ncbi:MAG: hypothetical protein CFE24_03110 [Flavobacterium sp. BFFFF2]|nr:MAG: hypothetical protein CFE24_03110 [Flavobacterium sp. BFFFF2]
MNKLLLLSFCVLFGFCGKIGYAQPHFNCSQLQTVCGAHNYPNTINVPSLTPYACLNTTSNPTYFSTRIAQSGTVKLGVTQFSLGGAWSDLFVDFAAWGPFNSMDEACTAMYSGSGPLVPVGSCIEGAMSSGTLDIYNAIAGQYYIFLVPNTSNQAGFVNFSQINSNDVGAGSIDCAGMNLSAFLDANSNGIQEANEANFTSGQFEYTVNNGAVNSLFSPNGTCQISDDNPLNNYNLNYTINPEFAAYYSVSAAFTNVNPAGGGMTNYNFPVTILQNYKDVGVSIVPMSAPRAGGTYRNRVIFANNGNQLIDSGVITFHCQAGTAIAYVSQTGTTAIANGFTYSFANLLPFESRSFTVTMNVPAIPVVHINQLLTNTVSVSGLAGDLVGSNNNSSCTQAVVAAYDPNDKIESHGEQIVYSTYDPTDYLQYTIRFENTGNAGALDVKVSDQLDAKLDPSSIKMVGASHAYTLDRVENQLVWNFMNIQLPVSVPDTDTGKGYVTFKVKVKPSYAIGDVIPNAASIYFDSNPAIVTNTFNTEFVSELLGTTQFDENHLQLYPNPASSTVHIHLQDSTESLSTIHVYDLLGKTVLSVPCSSNEQTLDVAPLLKGIYMVEINTESHMKWVKKLVVN